MVNAGSGSSKSSKKYDLIEDEEFKIKNDAGYSISLYTSKARYVALILSSLQMLLVSGIVFGWPALETELIQQNTFRYLCGEDEVVPCPKQSSRLNLVYTIGAFTATGSAFLTGALYDRYGPKKTNFLAFILLVLGFVLWFISYLYESNLYIVSFAFIGTGGPACQVSLLHISNLFPKTSSAISSSFSGMFVGSSIIFKIFQIIANKYDIKISYIFLVYMGLLLPLFIPTWLLLKNQPFLPFSDFKNKQCVFGNQETESNTNNNNNNNDESIPDENNSSNNNDGSIIGSDDIEDVGEVILSPVKDQPLSTQIFSKEFFSLCYFMSINSLHCVYYMGVVNGMFSNNQKYVDIFNYTWSGGLILVPFVGYIMVKTKLYMNCFLVNFSSIVFGILSSIEIDRVQLGAFFFASLLNVSLWGFYFIYLFHIFGNNNYGKLMGLSSIVTALIGLLEYLFVYLNNSVGASYSVINIALTCFKVPAFILVYFIAKSSKKDYILYSNLN
ncbi:hypothetical protein DICPUDRAFT_98947 [Dictyostelium purpureum]|uniref:Major facilitator superfamily (MFS) profile domain-containing protein n=1 Tax=Dictyostelium purpureum TaxID=5786 RepID=F0ZUY8_DICPU|nr:uncharacterized protein DICPUDRAFT_98947 [Dictyostelium purpureum]EGC32231.1 hypothetical protein DICPUDRAFT_98947 [Dictyostelium purpureum]|eukprot:XP_003291229.1 hypothetical protein DICPUDRAFT_98947 [Dictyostelium purpureum]